MKGRNGSTSLLPLNKKGGFINDVFSEKCLTKEQTKYVYNKVESGDELKVGKTTLDTQSNPLLPKQVKERKDINPYEKVLVSDINTMNKTKSQMEQWSILSDNIIYIRLVANDAINGIDIKMVDYQDHRRMYRRMGKEEGERMDIDFGESPNVLKDKYMDVYEDVFAVVTTNRFYENVDLSTMYLGKIGMRQEDIMKAEESFPISEQGFVMGRILNREECQILLDTGVSKSYMSKSYYLRCKALHDLPKFASKTLRIQVGNGQYVGVLFVIPVIIEICSHRLKVFTLVLEIFDNVDMVLGIKNLFQLEGVIDSQESCFRFMSRSIPIFPREQVVVKPGEKKLIPIESLFVEEISGMAIVTIIDQGQKTPMMLKLKFIWNKAMLDITNNTRETLIFDKKTTIGILDLRSLGYYKIKQGALQQNLNKYYHFEEANRVCEAFNKMVETVRQEEKDRQKEKYLWLDNTDERKYMMDREILDKYIDLRNSCLDETERKQVMEMLYEYKDVFSLRDETGMCPNIEVNIEVTENSPFFIRPYHVKEEDRAVLDKEMRRLCYLGILKEGFSAYLSPVMLISQKMTSDKRVVTDFRHLNMRIAKNNLAYPLLRDTFVLLGSSKCEVMSVLDLKDAFHSLQLSEKSQKYCGILPYFDSASYLYQRKCQLFRMELQYMGNIIFIKDRRVYVKPLHS